MNKFSTLENHPDIGPDLKVEPNPLGKFKDLLEPSSLGQINEPSPTQIVAGKDTPTPFMGEAFPKSMLVHLTQ